MVSDEPQQQTSFVPAILGFLTFYLGVLGLILLDEIVFHTFYFSRNSPDWLTHVVQIVYWPVIFVVQRFA